MLKLIQTFEAETSFQKIFQCRKNERGTLQSRPVLQRHENFWLKQGLELATAGFALNRLTSVPESCTCRMSSEV